MEAYPIINYWLYTLWVWTYIITNGAWYELLDAGDRRLTFYFPAVNNKRCLSQNRVVLLHCIVLDNYMIRVFCSNLQHGAKVNVMLLQSIQSEHPLAFEM